MKNSTYDVRLRAVNPMLRGRSMSEKADAFGTNRRTMSPSSNRFLRLWTNNTKPSLSVSTSGTVSGLRPASRYDWVGWYSSRASSGVH
jgi:hypothetical protein